MGRFEAVALFLIGGAAVAVMGQSSSDARIQSQLKQLFPSATAFSPKESQPPHFKAYLTDLISRRQKLEGFAFWTTDLEPLERGYDGPIKILVGNGHEGDPQGQEHPRPVQGRGRHRRGVESVYQHRECDARHQKQRTPDGSPIPSSRGSVKSWRG